MINDIRLLGDPDLATGLCAGACFNLHSPEIIPYDRCRSWMCYKTARLMISGHHVIEQYGKGVAWLES